MSSRQKGLDSSPSRNLFEWRHLEPHIRVPNRAPAFHRAALVDSRFRLPPLLLRFRGASNLRLGILLFSRVVAAICHALLVLTTRDDKVVVFAVAPPWTRWHIANLYKLPISYIGWRQSEVVTNGRRNIQASTVVKIRFGTLVPEDILEMICAKWTAI